MAKVYQDLELLRKPLDDPERENARARLSSSGLFETTDPTKMRQQLAKDAARHKGEFRKAKEEMKQIKQQDEEAGIPPDEELEKLLSQADQLDEGFNRLAGLR